MEKVSGILQKVLTNSFIASVISLLISVISPEDSIVRNLFGFIGFYGAIVTANLFILSVFLFFIRPLFKSK